MELLLPSPCKATEEAGSVYFSPLLGRLGLLQLVQGVTRGFDLLSGKSKEGVAAIAPLLDFAETQGEKISGLLDLG